MYTGLSDNAPPNPEGRIYMKNNDSKSSLKKLKSQYLTTYSDSELALKKYALL